MNAAQLKQLRARLAANRQPIERGEKYAFVRGWNECVAFVERSLNEIAGAPPEQSQGAAPLRTEGGHHRWGQKSVASANESRRGCLNGCDTVMVTRHEPGNSPPHWREYWRGDTIVARAGEPTPTCEPVGVGA